MEPNPIIQFSLRDALRVLFRHKYVAMGFFVVTLTIVVAGLIITPRSYWSESKLYVRVGNESLSVDPTVSTERSVSLNLAREEEIKSLLDLFRSQSIAEKVVRRMGADNVIRESLSDAATHPPSLLTELTEAVKLGVNGITGRSQVGNTERAVRKVFKAIEVSAQPKSSVILVAGKAKSAEFAQELVKQYVAAALEMHVEAHRTQQSLPFFEQQSHRLKQQLTRATQELRDLKSRYGLASLEGQARLLEAQVGELERQMTTAQTELETYQAKAQALRARWPEQASDHGHRSSSQTSRSLDEMRNQLYTLQIRAEEMAARYTESHPLRLAGMEQMKNAKRQLELQELQFAETAASTLGSRIATVRHEQRRASERLRSLNENEVRVRELEREVELLQANYRSYETNRETSRINDELRKQQITNINVIQPASLRQTPAAPSRRTLLLLGVAMALFGALGVALLLEFLDGTLKTSAEVETHTALPVLLSIPTVRQDSVLLN